jgi:S-sulfo-L-cysteine synthase (3-phospho-L-serine-dependent)
MCQGHLPWFALLESNTTGSGRQFCAAARVRGMRPVVLAVDPARYPYLAQDDVDVLILDTSDAAAVRAACRILADDGLRGITSSSEYFAGGAAVAANELGLPAPDAAAVTRCRHKDQQRAALASAGVPGPAFQVVTNGADAVSAAELIGWLVVIKPITGSGSAGVRRCGDPDETQGWVRHLHHWGEDRVLVEGYLDGPEFSVEVFDGAVVGVVAKHLGPAPYFVEIGHDFPASLDEPDRCALERAAMRAVRALGLSWGAAHAELRMTTDGPMIVEVNPRLAGGMIPTLIALSTGIDLVDAMVARASGQRPLPARRGHGHAAIRFLVAGCGGTVIGTSGPAAAQALPLIHAVLTVAPGDTVEITHSFRDRLGYVIATGESSSAAAGRAAEALSQFTVTMSAPRSLLSVTCNGTVRNSEREPPQGTSDPS